MSDVVRLAREPDWLVTVSHLLDSGAIVCYPTDTCYALGGDALDEDAVAKVLDAKGRPERFSLSVAVGGIDEIRHVARLTPLARRLAAQFLPGPLTLILPALPSTPDSLLAGGATVAVRVPEDPWARSLASHFGPLTATTASRDPEVRPRTVAEARAQMGGAVNLYLDPGIALPGTLSTIVDATGAEARIIRPGALSDHDLGEFHG